MSFVDIVGLCSELCLYMASVGFFVSLFGETLSPLWYFGVFFLCGLVCALLRNKRGIIRYAPLAMLALAFVGADSIAAVVLPIPAVFMLWLKARERAWTADYDRTKSVFSYGFVVLPIDVFAAFVSSRFAEMTARALPFFIVWMLLSVLNLRILRSPATMNVKTRAMNVLIVLLIALIGLGLSSDACVSAVLAVTSVIYTYVVIPLLFAIIAIAAVIPLLFAWLLSLLSRLFGDGSAAGEPGQFEANMEVIYDAIEGSQTPEWLIWLAIILLTSAFLLAVCAVIRKFAGKAGAARRPVEQLQYAAAPAQSAARRRKAFGKTPADVVRNCYCRYLILCGKRGIPVDGSAASDEICRMSESLRADSGAKELRALWLPARYSQEEIRESDASNAKRTLKTISKSFK